MTDTLVVPPELQVPRLRYWGDQKPPKNRVDMFSLRVATNAALTGGTADSSSEVTGSVATLRIYGPIDSWGGWWGVSAKDVATALDQLPDDVVEVRVRINSPGGEVWEGLAILNMLRAHQARAVAVVDGLAASAASVIAAGCEETVMSPGTQMMIHDPSGFAFGTADTMTKAAKFLESTGNAIASIYTEAAGGTDQGWRALMIEETWYTAAEAVDSGLADRVGVVSDAGETSTAGDEPEPTIVVVDPDGDGDGVEDLFDLSIYNHAGRSKAPAPKPPTASADGFTTTTQRTESAVAFSDAQLKTMRQELGLAEDADDATIVAALSEALKEQADDTPASTTTEVPEGMSLIETDVLNGLRDGATAGLAARDQQLAEHRDQVINKAIADGKVTPARREHWVQSWAADAEGTEKTLDGLSPGLVVPTDEIGTAADQEDAQLDPQTTKALDDFATSMGIPKEALHG